MTLKLAGAALTITLLTMSAGLITTGTSVAADEPARRITKRVMPVYPVLATKMKLSGTVKLTAVVDGGGQVTSVKVIGGHPVFIEAASDAAKQYVFQAASAESRETLTFVFAPQ